MKRFLAYCAGLLAATSACLGLLDLQEVGYGERPEAGLEAGLAEATPCADSKQTNCGGSCVLLASDPKHCGRCGRDCAVCTEGRCEAEVIAELPKVNGAYAESTYGVLVDETWLYFTTWPARCLATDAVCNSGGGIWVKKKNALGGNPENLRANHSAPGHMTRIGKDVFWASWYYSVPEAGTAGVRSVALNAGGGFSEIREYCPDSRPCEQNYILTSDGSRLVVSEFKQGIRAYDLDGGSILGVKNDPDAGLSQPELRGVAVDNDRVYWTTAQHVRSISRALFLSGAFNNPTQQTTHAQFASGSLLDHVKVEGEYLYFTDRSNSILYRTRKTNPPGSEEILATGLESPRAIAVEPGGNTVYITSFGGSKVLAVRQTGGTWSKETLKGALDGPTDVTFDNDYVYFTGGLDGKVWRIRK